MEHERIINLDGRIEIWAYEWDLTSKPPNKINRVRLGIEQPPSPAVANSYAGEAISWSYGRTLGNIATTNYDLIREFPGPSGQDAILSCEIVAAGKFRNGKDRWWCRTHQKHWGTQADLMDATQTHTIRCAQRTQPMSYVVNPYELALDQYAEVGVWCSLPPAITSRGIPVKRRPRIHVHVREQAAGWKTIDQDFDALTLLVDPAHQLFGATLIDRVHVTPPAAKEFVLALEYGKTMTCFNCRDCGSPHLDMGGFTEKPHTKHLCGNCGRDNTWTTLPSISSPLKPVHDFFDKGYGYYDVTNVLDLDAYPSAEFAVWASTPAIVWTADRPQERGIHVHLNLNGNRIIDETFGTVIYQGQRLVREHLLDAMTHNTLNH